MYYYHKIRLLLLLLIFAFWACGQEKQKEEPVTQAETPVYSESNRTQKPVQVSIDDNRSKDIIQRTQEDISNSRQTAITRAVEKLEPAVVGINVTQIREYVPHSTYDDPFFRFFFPNYRYRQEVKSLGSGFIISPDGFIVTNEHVVQGAVKVVVSLLAGKKYDAEVIGTDYVTDIALLKIEGDNFPYVELGDSDDILIGEWVIALGNPFGLFEIGQQPSVTVGVVSSKNLDFGRQDDDRLYQGMIQTDAAINPGNSGGPMANALGQVIGMNAFIFTGSDYSRGSIGLGFAIPIDKVKDVVNQLKESGKVDRQFWTGLEVENLRTSVARYFGLNATKGVIVTNVESNSPADRAGLQVGDIILELNQEKIETTQDIWKVINDIDAKAGDVIHLKILRKSRTVSINLKLGKVS